MAAPVSDRVPPQEAAREPLPAIRDLRSNRVRALDGRHLDLEDEAAVLDALERLPDGAVLLAGLPAPVLGETAAGDLVSAELAGRVVVELSHLSEVDDRDALAAGIARLREHGLRVAFDDSGAGFGSLADVCALRPGFLRVPPRLLAGVDADLAQRGVVSALVALAAQLDMELIADVPTAPHGLELLRRLGIHLGSGDAVERDAESAGAPAGTPAPATPAGLPARPEPEAPTAGSEMAAEPEPVAMQPEPEPEAERAPEPTPVPSTPVPRTAPAAPTPSPAAPPVAPVDLLIVPEEVRTGPLDDDGEAGRRPSVIGKLPSRSLRSFPDALRVGLRSLERHLPTAALLVAHLDARHATYSVVEARGVTALPLQSGYSTPIRESLCFHMSRGQAPQVVEDATEDPTYASLTMRNELGIVSYVGVPLLLRDGRCVGSLAATSRTRAAFGADELEALAEVGPMLAEVLQAEHVGSGPPRLDERLASLSRLDGLTGVLNRARFEQAQKSKRMGWSVSVRIANLPDLNHSLGRTVGDALLRDFSRALTSTSRASDIVGRTGGGTFSALLPDCHDREGALLFAQRAAGRFETLATSRGARVRLEAAAAPTPQG